MFTFIVLWTDVIQTQKSGAGFVAEIQKVCDANDAHIASVVGRFYAMDRDKRWNRVKEAYDLLVEGKGVQATDMVKAVEASYAEGVTDEFYQAYHKLFCEW